MKYQIKRASLLYKIGNLTNISKISLQTQWLLLGEARKQSNKKKNEQKKQRKIVISLRPAVTSVSSSHLQLENKIQTRVPSYSAISLKSLVPCGENKGLRRGEEAPSSLLSSQAGEQRLSWEQKAEQGHRKAHPGRQVLSLMPHELRGDRKKNTY